MLDAGVQVAAIVDVAPAVRGDAALRSVLESAGVPLLTSHVVEVALGDREVTGVQLRTVDAAMQPVGDSPVAMACDTVCMAFGVVPNVELAAQTGCALDYQVSRGGWVPALDEELRTSLPFIRVVGDGAGVTEAMLLDSAIAADQGQRAARALAGVKGIDVPPMDRVVGARDTGRLESPTQEWLRALVAVGGLDVVVCQCEEVTRRDVLEVRPPRYVPGAADARAVQLSATARASQDVVKRLTRAGMGHCQGKRCRDQTALLIADPPTSGTASVVPGSYRPPLRPLPLNVIADHDETEEMRRGWPTWFHPVNEGEIG
jgi:hypothetical protein